jgi:Copper transport outer membrane protein, MctB
MFDLRYHVASLAAVFLALLIGILVGVGVSGRVDESKNDLLRERIDDLNARLESAGESRAGLVREQKAARAFMKDAYPQLIEDRLRGKRIAIVFVGSVHTGMRDHVEQALSDSGARTPLRMRALNLPMDVEQVDRALGGHTELEQFRGDDALGNLGRELGTEFVSGGQTPAWDVLTPLLVKERAGRLARAADGVVVVRTTAPQRGQTARFLSAFYAGLADSGVPAVGVETAAANPSAVPVWRRTGLSTVDDVNEQSGRLALALLLAGGRGGSYGIKEDADDGLVPPLDSVPEPEAGG